MDVIARFLEEKCNMSGEVGATKLYQAYKAWCEDCGERWEKQTGFGLQLAERGLTKEKTREGIVYQGLSLLSVNSVNSVNSNYKSSSGEKNTSQKGENNPSHYSHYSQSEDRSKPPDRACYHCGMQNWQWDSLIENYTCGGCNHG